jgi:MFS family permease
LKYITRTVWILSLVSLLTDAASEMLYPIMPIYLKSIGFSVVLIGILEGLAEAIAGLSKGYFGKWSDTSGKRLPFVQVGYALSAFSKPMMAVFVFPLWIFLARTADRFGKGIRTAARDALLSEEATMETKAKVFGFHRSMDTLGAVIGPLLALIYLYYEPQNYRGLFFIAFLPGILAILVALLLKEKNKIKEQKTTSVPFFSFLSYWSTSPREYKKLVAGLLVFTLFNSSDVFLLLKAKESGIDDATLIGVYIFYNLVYAFFAFPLGVIADKFGLKSVFLAGIGLFVMVYSGMVVMTNLLSLYGLFFLYGLYAAATEGVSKAWISNISPPKEMATAIGTFTGLQSICAMLASTLTGLIWFKFGAATAFLLTAFVSTLVFVYFLTVPKPTTFNKKTQH